MAYLLHESAVVNLIFDIAPLLVFVSLLTIARFLYEEHQLRVQTMKRESDCSDPEPELLRCGLSAAERNPGHAGKLTETIVHSS